MNKCAEFFSGLFVAIGITALIYVVSQVIAVLLGGAIIWYLDQPKPEAKFEMTGELKNVGTGGNLQYTYFTLAFDQAELDRIRDKYPTEMAWGPQESKKIPVNFFMVFPLPDSGAQICLQ